VKNCKGCKHAKWNTTVTGRLSPTGDGRCTYEIKPPVVPAAFYYIPHDHRPLGGHINRKKEHANHCPTYTRD
jgi:hypothetical protein